MSQPAAPLLHEFFERTAGRWPAGTALEIPPGAGRPERRRLAYRELERRSNGLARRLGEFIEGECVAAILLPRHAAELHISQLAVLKAGGAFTSIDPAYPEGRIRDILDDSAAPALLTDSAGRERARAAGYGGKIIDVTRRTGEASAPPPKPAWLTPQSLAYVIYTSGTTGRPKGVMIEHRAIANLVASDIAEFGLVPEARVGQSSSAAYDSFLEETWMAFGAGAAVVVIDDETARLGPDLVPWLRDERITVLCPPPTLLRATGCERPDLDLPDLSLLYVGGEALPPDIADRWGRGRRLVNGYGPTECSVTALRGEVRGGEPIAIGRPVPGLCAWAVSESLEEVSEGQWGELVIGGAGLARGYWRVPELTARKFIVHPRLGRIYRTGDLAHREADGRYFYHGRADSQVKIRGYRVELEEIESRLAACRGVRAAACRLQVEGGQESLVAFLVPERDDAPPSIEELRRALGATLPSHMIPVRFGFLRELPVTVGGKLDRNALPRLEAPASGLAASATAPRDALEHRLADAFQQILGLREAVSIHADFFTGLGGDSLRAAQLISRLRKEDAATAVAVRDLYEARSVAELAKRMRSSPPNLAEAKPEERTRGRPLAATLIQAAWIAANFWLAVSAAYVVVFDLLPPLARALGLIPFLLLGPVAGFAALALYTPLAVGAAVLVKRCLIGRYRPLRAPVWGGFYVRHWIVRQAARWVPWPLLEGTAFQLAALRALGARIGQRVHIHRGVDLRQGGWDLLEIGDDVTLSQDASLGLVELEDGHVVIGAVSLGSGVTLEVRAGVAGGARMEAGAYLTALSWLAPGACVPAGELWDGVPAAPAGRAPAPPEATPGLALPVFAHAALAFLARYVIAAWPALVLSLVAVCAAIAQGTRAERVLEWLANPAVEVEALIAAPLLGVLAVPVSLALEALFMRMLGRVDEGVVRIESLSYVRVWLKAGLLRTAGNWLSGTLFWPVWLRWTGMKVGPGCEISTIIDVVPELIEIGPECFLADGIYLGGPRLHRGVATLAKTRLERNTFLGNHAVIPAGSRLPENVLLGVCTAVPKGLAPGASWFGHPPFELPVREVVKWDRRFTTEPSPIRYWNRVFWELLRCTLPIAPVLAVVMWVESMAPAEAVMGRPLVAWAAAPRAAGAAATALCLLTLALKWALLGRVRPGQHPLWSCWCSRWDFLYVAWGFWARRVLSAFEGTLLLSWYPRAMGMRIGKRVALGGGFAQVVDPDMLRIEDGATVSCMFQAHTFEDRVLKIDRIHIGKGATLGSASVPLYGADIGAGASVSAHGVVMKHEHLLPGVRYEGAPAHIVQASRDH